MFVGWNEEEEDVESALGRVNRRRGEYFLEGKSYGVEGKSA